MILVIENSEIINIQHSIIGEIALVNRVVTHPVFSTLENIQSDSKTNQLFVSNTLDDQSLVFLIMGN